MLVKMRKRFTGFRDGVEWPPVGQTIEVGAAEGRRLIRHGYAEEVTDEGTADEPVVATADGSDGAAEGEPVLLSKLKVGQLRDLAEQRGVAVEAGAKKADLIAALQAAGDAANG